MNKPAATNTVTPPVADWTEEDGIREDDEVPVLDMDAIAKELERSRPEQLALLMDQYAEILRLNPHYGASIYRDNPLTDKTGRPCKGYVGKFDRPYYIDDLKKEFGGGVYTVQVKGPVPDKVTGKRRESVIRSVWGIEVAGWPRPSARDNHYKSDPAGLALAREQREAEARMKRGDDRDDEDDSREDGKSLDDTGKRLSRRQLEEQHVALGWQTPPVQPAPIQPLLSAKPTELEKMRLEAEIVEQRARRAREEQLQDRLMGVADNGPVQQTGAGGLDLTAVKSIIADVKAGSESAVQQAFELLSNRVNAPRDDREEQRLKEIHQDARVELRELRTLHQAELTRLDVAHREEIQGLRGENVTTVAATRRDLREAFDKERDGWQRGTERLEATVQAAVAATGVEEKRGNDRVEAIKEAHKALLETVKSSTESEVRRLRDKIENLESNIESRRDKEIVLRDERQATALAGVKTEMQRDQAIVEAGRLDIEQITRAAEAGERVATALGYAKSAEGGKTGPWGTIAEKAVDGFVSLLGSERFAAVAAQMAQGGAASVAKATKGQPGLPAGEAPRTNPGPATTYDDVVAHVREARKKADVETDWTTEPSANFTEPQEPPTQAVQPTHEPLPRVDWSTELDQKQLLIQALEELVQAGTPPAEGVKQALTHFNIDREIARNFLVGKGADDLLSVAGVNPFELTTAARLYLDAALEEMSL